MVKKKVSKKKVAKRKVAKKKVVKKMSSSNSNNIHNTKAIERLIDSNLAVQHKMTDVLLGVKDLNSNVKELVHIFKKAGEHIKASKYEDPMVNKLDDLLEQNKKISQALLMLEKFVKTKPERQNPLNPSNGY
ncbi:hypothetical protein HN681_02990 [archaeon]|jgi:hypothetical protein|nr:hypothetical protein [archaeon]MBT3731226.1 hypothetical protein [archaeon]MBT4670020.1 hypothetical protein [archaeon]MBT5287778.1 hypothetical protein [archaeon]MBT7052783.1 hypothetical protein [archaeon]